jgi:hypothetical protein
MLFDGAGTVSYQAVEVARPDRVQSTSVPICSSAGEPELKPPSPTQNEEKPSEPGRHDGAGWVHDALTVRNARPGRWIAYPAQLVLSEVSATALGALAANVPSTTTTARDRYPMYVVSAHRAASLRAGWLIK